MEQRELAYWAVMSYRLTIYNVYRIVLSPEYLKLKLALLRTRNWCENNPAMSRSSRLLKNSGIL